MSGVAISIGGVVLQDFEVPERVFISAEQRVALHQLIGGGRIIDALGADSGDIEFSGAFSGDDAGARAQVLDAAAALGAQIPLYWDSFFYMVVIKQYEVNFEKPWWIPFSIRCAVVLDPTANISGIVNSVADMVIGDVSSALSMAPQAGVILGLSGPPNLAGITQAQNIASSALGSANASLASQAAGLNGASEPGMAVMFVDGLANTSAQIAALSNISGYLRRASINLANEFS